MSVYQLKTIDASDSFILIILNHVSVVCYCVIWMCPEYLRADTDFFPRVSDLGGCLHRILVLLSPATGATHSATRSSECRHCLALSVDARTSSGSHFFRGFYPQTYLFNVLVFWKNGQLMWIYFEKWVDAEPRCGEPLRYLTQQKYGTKQRRF